MAPPETHKYTHIHTERGKRPPRKIKPMFQILQLLKYVLYTYMYIDYFMKIDSAELHKRIVQTQAIWEHSHVHGYLMLVNGHMIWR